MIGTNNHDGAPLRALAEGSRPEYVERVKDNAKVLSKQMGFSTKKQTFFWMLTPYSLFNFFT